MVVVVVVAAAVTVVVILSVVVAAVVAAVVVVVVVVVETPATVSSIGDSWRNRSSSKAVATVLAITTTFVTHDRICNSTTSH